MRTRILVLIALIGALAAAPGAGATAQPPFKTVMTALDNPRGLAWGPDGALFVAEAGKGGPRPCFAGEGGQTFAGFTGAISRLKNNVQSRVVTGLPSHAAQDGSGALGPHNIAIVGNAYARVTIGLGTDPADRPSCGNVGPKLGWIVRAFPNGRWNRETDLAAYEAANNPDGGVPDSDPYGILWNGTSTIATDAGGNDLLEIHGKSITTLATFPSRAQGRYTDSVPTTVVTGPDGAYYVGELTGAPFTPGQANVYRVVPGQKPTIFASGFSFIIDVIFGPDGSMYVLEFATGPDLSGPGDLIRVEPNGTRTVVATGFFAPGNVTIGPDKRFYVSNCSIFPGTGPFPCHGEVVRFKG
jgi:hypothetical protein